MLLERYQSPYKGFNSHQKSLNGQRDLLYQSPYKGFNRLVAIIGYIWIYMYQSPYKGFNRLIEKVIDKFIERLNPPIRGSIEQDNALFRNYNHKR